MIYEKTQKKTIKFKFVYIVSILILFISLVVYRYSSSDNNIKISINEIPDDNIKKSINKVSDDNIKKPINKLSEKIIKKDELKIENINNQTFLDKFKEFDLTQFAKKIENEDFKCSNVDQFNNNHLLPRLLSIVDMDYFKYIKFNLNKKCKLWSDDAKCSKKDCTISVCDESRLPDYIIKNDEEEFKELNRLHTTKEELLNKDCSEDQVLNTTIKLQEIINTISNDKISTMNDLFECYVSEYEEGNFYDLKMNPEQYTGYKGPTANRIWRSIYEENCFKSKKIHQLMDLTETNSNNVQVFESFLNVDDLCLEEKIFYRAISGLHTSINIHLSNYYHFKDGLVGANLKEFLKRFEGKYEYLKNLYFLFLLELKALNKIENYLLTKVNWQSSGNELQTKEAIKDVLKVINKFKWKFDENIIFNMKEFRIAEFAEHFRNISTTIMDCVACDKCKLWGKVQIHALGTAFKILFTDFNSKVQLNEFHLHRHEISTLFNGITRLSNSINSLSIFNSMIKNSQDSLLISPNNLEKDVKKKANVLFFR